MHNISGEDKIEKLAANFIKQEEENFALFSYVNELNDEMEGLQTRVEQLRIGIDEAKDRNTERGQKQAETLEKLKKDLEEETRLADEAEESLAEVLLKFINEFVIINHQGYYKSPVSKFHHFSKFFRSTFERFQVSSFLIQ